MTEAHLPGEGREQQPVKDQGNVLHRLRGIDGEPLQPPLTQRILGNPAINTVVVFSGEAGGGKSTVLGQLDREFQAASVRTYHVFTEDALAETEEELTIKRGQWGKEEYDRMADNLYRMILREKERMREEGTEGRAMLFVETMALPAADDFNRGHTAMTQLEKTQEEHGVFDTFYVGLPANPAIQDRANEVRDRARETAPEDIIGLLSSMHINVTGIEGMDSAEVGRAIKEALARQATRPRLELIRKAVTDAARKWAGTPGKNVEVAAVIVPEGSSEDYQVKSAYINHVLRNIFNVPSDRGVVALSPFDPELPVEWNVEPFLKIEEEVSEEYPPAQKEVVLKAARDVLTDEEGSRSVLTQESLAIARGKTTSEVLELLPGPQLVASLKIMRDALQANPDTYPPPAELSDPHSYESQKRRRFQGALQNIRHKLITRDQDILSAQNRKALGMASSGQDIIDLANAIEEVSTQGLISNENKLTLVNVFGSFDPFAHTGHLAVAEQAHNEVAQTGMDTRVVMSTFAANPKKPATEGTFPQRVDNLHRAMLEVPFVTALGIAGDFSNIEKRRAQTELLASLDKDGKFRRACGSDVLEVQLDRAKGGDDFAKSLFQSTDVLYVCPRRGYVKDVFARQLAEVRSMYPHIELVQLGEIGVARSGTHLRTLEPEQRRRYATNRHVNMAI